MKTLISLIFAFSLIGNIQSQYPGDPLIDIMIDFNQNDTLLKIDTSLVNNIWEIGEPGKPIFNSAFSIPNAICTNLENNYSANNYSSFQLNIVSNVFGRGILEFNHKYQTDLGNAGGYIELSYDNGKNWSNLVFENIQKINFYDFNDTIFQNTPAFSGSLNEWGEVRCDFLWYALVKSSHSWPVGWGLGMYENPDTLMLKFIFKSNDIANENEGWMIDDIHFLVWDISNSMNEYQTNEFNLNYQPNKRIVHISLNKIFQSTYSVIVYDLSGRIFINETCSPEVINFSNLENGIYIFSLTIDSKFQSKKIMIY